MSSSSSSPLNDVEVDRCDGPGDGAGDSSRLLGDGVLDSATSIHCHEPPSLRGVSAMDCWRCELQRPGRGAATSTSSGADRGGDAVLGRRGLVAAVRCRGVALGVQQANIFVDVRAARLSSQLWG